MNIKYNHAKCNHVQCNHVQITSISNECYQPVCQYVCADRRVNTYPIVGVWEAVVLLYSVSTPYIMYVCVH